MGVIAVDNDDDAAFLVRLAGVDEAGRGPLAGPVVAAAVILDAHRPITGLADSKTLSATKRTALAAIIRERAMAWAIAAVSAQEVDRINIRQATLKAMRDAVAQLAVTPTAVWVDGNDPPAFTVPTRAIVKGDRTVPAISAASILAKVYRDDWMIQQDAQYPQYGFAVHKGYPTMAHRDALWDYGPCPIHRRSCATVIRALMVRQAAAD